MIMFFLDLLGDPCNNSNILKVVYFIKQIINIVLTVVPIGVILVGTLDFFKNIIAKTEDTQKKDLNVFIKRIIFMIVLFLIPTIVGIVTDLIYEEDNDSKSLLKCIGVSRETLKSRISSEKASCTSKGGTWNSKTESCTTKDEINNGAQIKSQSIRERNNSKLRYSSQSSNSGYSGKYPIADAALRMAFPTEAQATGTYGTSLYVNAYDKVLSDQSAYRNGSLKESSAGTTRYKSCAEAVTVFVRFSGVDDEFGSKGTNPGALLSYVRSSPKWQNVNWNGDYNKLQPGDVFVDGGHAMLYVGTKMLHDYFPKAPVGYNLVQASYHRDYIHQAKSPYIMNRTDLKSSRWTNNAFRCIKPDKNFKYANLKKTLK